MDRNSFSSVLDEAVNQLNHEVSVLQNQKQTLTINLQDLEKQRDKLSQDIIDFTSKKDALIKEHQDKIDGMTKDAQDKLDRANSRDAEAAGKLSDYNQKLKEAQDLINSNEGMKKNLESLNIESKNKTDKLNMIFQVIKEHVS